MKKTKQECHTIRKIKIEKIIEWKPTKHGERPKTLLYIATIKGWPTKKWTTSFNATNKREFWRRLKDEIHL